MVDSMYDMYIKSRLGVKGNNSKFVEILLLRQLACSDHVLYNNNDDDDHATILGRVSRPL